MTRGPSIAAIQLAAADEFRVSLRVMTAESRVREYVGPRQAAMALAFGLTGLGSPLIGRQFGDRDHTTVLHACKVIAERRAHDPELDGRLRRIEARFLSPSPPRPPEPIQLAFLDGPLFDLAPVYA